MKRFGSPNWSGGLSGAGAASAAGCDATLQTFRAYALLFR